MILDYYKAVYHASGSLNPINTTKCHDFVKVVTELMKLSFSVGFPCYV